MSRRKFKKKILKLQLKGAVKPVRSVSEKHSQTPALLKRVGQGFGDRPDISRLGVIRHCLSLSLFTCAMVIIIHLACISTKWITHTQSINVYEMLLKTKEAKCSHESEE